MQKNMEEIEFLLMKILFKTTNWRINMKIKYIIIALILISLIIVTILFLSGAIHIHIPMGSTIFIDGETYTTYQCIICGKGI